MCLKEEVRDYLTCILSFVSDNHSIGTYHPVVLITLNDFEENWHGCKFVLVKC